jgi:hypothetical protein
MPTGWNAVLSPRVGAEGNLTAVSARSATDAWAVGQYEGIDSLQRTLVEHWDGSQWSVVASSSPGAEFNILQGVSADASIDAWAVGYQTDATGKNQPLIEHWDGSSWSQSTSPSVNASGGELSGVAAVSPNDVWAVGDVTVLDAHNQFHNQSPLIEHWNGSTWTVMSGAAIPAPSAGSSAYNALSAVAALAPNNIWAVGEDNAPGQQGPGQYAMQALVEHWDGAHWSLMPAASPNPNGNALTGIAAISASDIWAVGTGPLSSLHGCGAGPSVVAEHWDGVRWTSVPVAQPSGSPYQEFSLASVAAVASDNVWAVGGVLSYYRGQSSAYSPVIEHWNGSTWSIVSGPTNGTVSGLTNIAATHTGVLMAVGQAEAANGPGATLVEQYSGSTWAVADSPSPGTLSNELKAITAISPSDIWAVGDSAGGTLTEHWNGSAWGYYPSPNGAPADDVLNGVAASAPNDVWTVGTMPGSGYNTSGLIEHWDGSQWSVVAGVTTGGQTSLELHGVAALSGQEAWAVGGEAGPFAEHWDGAQWKAVPTPSSAPGTQLSADVFLSVAAISANDVWAVGGNPPHSCGGLLPALIEHWNGKQWSVIPNTPQGLLQSVSADSATDVWAVGSYGASTLVMHYDGKGWSVVPVPAVFKPQTPNLFGVAARAANDVWAVGSAYTQQSQLPIILHWNGTAWSQATVSGPGVVTNVLNGVAAVGPANVWAVGYYGDAYSTNSTQALIEHYTG